MSEHDTVLLQRWTQAQDAEAFRDLVERYSGFVYAAAKRILGDVDQADDVTQECFLVLARDHSVKSRLGAWLHRVATNLAISARRTEERRRRRETRWAEDVRPSGELPWSELRPFIDEAIEALPEPQRIVLVEHFLHGRTREDLAGQLGVSCKTIGNRVHLAIESIRVELKRRGLQTSALCIGVGLEAIPTDALVQLPLHLSMNLQKIAIGAKLPVGAVLSLARSGGMASKPMVTMLSLCVLVLTGLAWMRSSGEPSPVRDGLAASRQEAEVRDDDDVARGVAVDQDDATREEVTGDGAAARVSASLTGLVRTQAGDPVAGARVVVAWHKDSSEDLSPDYWKRTNSIEVLSDTGGRFTIVGLPRVATARLAVFEDGYHANCLCLTLPDVLASPQVISLVPGSTLRGSVLGVDGAPVVDAVVSVYHSYNATGIAGGMNFALTQSDGQFELSLDSAATLVTLRVNSQALGQQFFVRVSTADDLILRYTATGTIHGSITWGNGLPAEGTMVCVEAQIPEPRVFTFLSGWRPSQQLHQAVDAAGRYRIEGIHPGFNYSIYLVDLALAKDKRFLRTLTQRWKESLVLSPGEVKVWDRVVTRPMRLSGRVVTRVKRAPVAGIQIGAEKDGVALYQLNCETNAEGEYDLTLNAGPGNYVITPTPESSWADVTGLIGEQFSQSVRAQAGTSKRLDLEIFDPIEIPIAVFDADGKPVESINQKMNYVLPSGRRHGVRTSGKGRQVLSIYHPVRELSLEVSTFPNGPQVVVGPFHPALGDRLIEQRITLPRTCDLRAQLTHADGRPCAGQSFSIRARYEDGSPSSTFYAKTKSDGSLVVKSQLRASALTLTIKASKGSAIWQTKRERVDATPGAVLDLGVVVMEVSQPDK